MVIRCVLWLFIMYYGYSLCIMVIRYVLWLIVIYYGYSSCIYVFEQLQMLIHINELLQMFEQNNMFIMIYQIIVSSYDYVLFLFKSTLILIK